MHALATNELLRSTIGSASIISSPSGSSTYSWGSEAVELVDIPASDRLGVSSVPIEVFASLVSSRTVSPAAFSDSCSWYHLPHFSLTFSSPSKTHSVSGAHSTPSTLEMKVRRTDPKMVGETPKAPMYFDKSCSCGGADEGYDEGKDTSTENVTWS